jgi:hypothetical protein
MTTARQYHQSDHADCITQKPPHTVSYKGAFIISYPIAPWIPLEPYLAPASLGGIRIA